MGGSTSASGAATTWRVTEFMSTPMESGMTGSTHRTRRKGTASTIGRMAAGMKDSGPTGSSMASEYTGIIRNQRSLVSGKGANESNGLISTKLTK